MAEKSAKKSSGSLGLGDIYLVFYNLILTFGYFETTFSKKISSDSLYL